MGLLIYLLFAMVFFTFSMIAIQLFSNINVMGRLLQRRSSNEHLSSPRDHQGEAGNVAAQLKALEEVRSKLRTQYPVVARMFGAYLHGESLHNSGSVENAVKEMVLDWRSEKDAVILDIARILADNPDEESVRAIIVLFCDVSFDQEGYRTWLVWLQGQFNDL